MARGETGGDPFEARLEATLRGRAMVAPGDAVLVAVSGGPDSLALLRGLWAVRPALEIRLHVGHVDHGLRGAGSAADAAAVAGIAARLGLPCTVERLDPATLRGPAGRQAAARRARLQALEAMAARVGARRIALGHNREDQAETVLMRLLRGAGVDGLAGIRPVRGPFIHPLLDVSRADAESYLKQCGIEPRRDPTNLEPVYLRNAIRLRLVPLLERRFNPRLVLALAALAQAMQDDADFLRDEADRAWRRVAVRDQDPAPTPAHGAAPTPTAATGELTLSLRAFRREAPAMQSRIVREAFRRACGSPYAPPRAQVLAVRQLAAGPAGGALDLASGVVVRRAGDHLTFGPRRP